MNLVIVPTDFSDSSFNAAQYAVKLLTNHPEVEIILYHVYDNPDAFDNTIENLERLKNELLQNKTANITTLAEQGVFLTEVEKLARHRQADLVVMGIKGRSSLAQIFIGSNSLKMAENKYCPVLIIPVNSTYSEIQNVLLTSDLKNVVSTTPSAPIKKVLKTFDAKLHIVNVNTEHYIAVSEKYSAEEQRLKEMFAEFNPEFYFLRLYDIYDAIQALVEDKKIDMIITVHKEHSLVHKLFRPDHSKQLAYQSTVPVMIVHE